MAQKLIIYEICIILIQLVIQTFCQSLGKDCRTPNDIPGKCVVLSSCPSLVKLLNPPLIPKNLRFLQKSTCDFTSFEPKGCCPESELPTPPTTTSKTTTTPRPNPTTTTTLQQPKGPIPVSSANNTAKQDELEKIKSHPNLNLLPSSVDCGISLLDEHITGGKDAGLGHFPFMALIGYTVEGVKAPTQFACGGTLINSRYILTAAHCVTKLPEGFKPTIVRLGEYNQATEKDCEGSLCAPPVQDMSVEEILVHENYDKTSKKENDIAIIRLKLNPALGPFVSPICLPHGERLQKIGNTPQPIVAGWGRLESSNPDGAQTLQMVKVPFVKTEKCNAVYKDILGKEIDSGRFCAGGEKGFDSCQGDSGGPLMLPFRATKVNGKVRIFQFGVVSLGPKNCDTAGLPALYTNVSYFMRWILDHLKP